jgi:hypothetical protein
MDNPLSPTVAGTSNLNYQNRRRFNMSSVTRWYQTKAPDFSTKNSKSIIHTFTVRGHKGLTLIHTKDVNIDVHIATPRMNGLQNFMTKYMQKVMPQKC